jgi:hypothetical protein
MKKKSKIKKFYNIPIAVNMITGFDINDDSWALGVYAHIVDITIKQGRKTFESTIKNATNFSAQWKFMPQESKAALIVAVSRAIDTMKNNLIERIMEQK